MIDLTRERLLNPKPGYVFTHYSGKCRFTVVQVRGRHVVTEYDWLDGREKDIVRYTCPEEMEQHFRFPHDPGHTVEYSHDEGEYKHWPQGLKGRMADIIQETEDMRL